MKGLIKNPESGVKKDQKLLKNWKMKGEQKLGIAVVGSLLGWSIYLWPKAVGDFALYVLFVALVVWLIIDLMAIVVGDGDIIGPLSWSFQKIRSLANKYL